MKENNRGVTLIALAITIIVLLIISGITITAGSYNAEKAKDNKLLSEVVMVQNAVLQRKTKAELINGHYPGQKLTEIGITAWWCCTSVRGRLRARLSSCAHFDVRYSGCRSQARRVGVISNSVS